MPDYPTITLHQDLTSIENKVKAAKQDGTYAGKQATLDQEVIQAIRAGLEAAKNNTVAHTKDVEACRAKCQERVNFAEAQLKKKHLEEKDYTAIKSYLGSIKKFVDELHEWRRQFATAMAAGFRGGWPDVAKRTLSDPALYNQFEAQRKTMIDLDNKVSGLTARCDEYVGRAAEFLKQTIQREKGGAVEVQEFLDDIKNHKQQMTDHKAFIEDKILKARSATTFFENLGKKKEKEYNATDLKSGTAFFATLERAAKECRGRLKTMTTEHDGLEKRAKAAGPGWKEDALKAVKESEKVCGETKALSGDFDKAEEKAKKVLEKLKKAVG